MKNLILILTLLSSTLIIKAQIPQAFNYQGVLRDLSGNTINNTNVTVRFTIQAGSAGGTVEYQESHSTSTNDFGIITLSVGLGSPLIGTFTNIDWSTGTKFLQVEFDPNGGTNYTILGSSQILSVPYALYSASSGSGTSQWVNGSNNTIHYNLGRVGVGLSYPSAGLDVVRNGSDSLGTIPLGRFTANDSNGTGFDEGAFVEIATNDFRGGLRLGGTQFGSNNNIGSLLHTTGGWQWDKQLNIMGKLGIGYNTPYHSLQVNGNMAFTSRGQKLIFASQPDDSNACYISRPIGTDGILMNGYDIYIRSIVTPVQLQTSNTVVVTDLNSIGKFVMNVQNNRMGIGTTAPSSSVTVVGGDVEIKDINSGIIMKSPNGNCWRITIDNSGNLIRTAITCP